jgi:hypothetical protein
MRNSYDHEDYIQLTAKVSRHPLSPIVGHGVFIGLIALGMFAKSVMKFEYAGIPLLILLMLYPYYCVQLLMQWRMRKHQIEARIRGMNPTYIPSSPRGWAAVYIGAFFAIAGVVLALEKLFSR